MNIKTYRPIFFQVVSFLIPILSFGLLSNRLLINVNQPYIKEFSLYLSLVTITSLLEFGQLNALILSVSKTKKNDLRIITLNYNLRAKKKLYFLPDKLYPILSEKFPFLYDWDLPKDLEDILRSFDMKSGFAHGCGLIPIKPLKEIGGYNEEMIGYGPEDDLFNRRLALNARTYYHKGTFRSSTFHICHRNLNHQNKLSNWLYWKKIIYDLNRNGVHSDGRIINR